MALEYLASRLQVEVQSNGRVPVSLAEWVSSTRTTDAQFKMYTDPIYSHSRTLHPELQAGWQQIGGLIVRRSADKLKGCDVIAIVVPGKHLNNPTALVLKYNLDSLILDLSVQSDDKKEFFQSVGRSELWESE